MGQLCRNSGWGGGPFVRHKLFYAFERLIFLVNLKYFMVYHYFSLNQTPENEENIFNKNKCNFRLI